MNLRSYPEDGFKKPQRRYKIPWLKTQFRMDKLGKIRQHHWKERFKISKIA